MARSRSGGGRGFRRPEQSIRVPVRRLGLECYEARLLLNGIPILNSRPGAPATLYLDFDGHFAPHWKESSGVAHNVTFPAFDRDNNPGSYSAAEQAEIIEIWERVSEDYSPFDINVTTSLAGLQDIDFEIPKATRVVIGGYDSREQYIPWLSLGGLSGIGSFADPTMENLAHVSLADPDDNLVFTTRNIADIAAHEAGHGFGLDHQLNFAVDGTFLGGLNAGTPERAPLMGNFLKSERSVWWVTPEKAEEWQQNDLDIIAAEKNKFGYRKDDFDNTLAQPKDLGAAAGTGTVLTASGVITRFDNSGVDPDVDFFAGEVPSSIAFLGAWHAKVNVIDRGPNLDAKLTVFDTNDQPLFTDDSASSLDADVMLVDAGKFKFAVESHGEYGDLGQYTFVLRWESNLWIRSIRLISLPPLIDTICDPAGPYPPWGKESLENVTKLAILQDERLDGQVSTDGRPLVENSRWRAELFERTAATLNPLLARHDLGRLDMETFDRALKQLWNSPERQLPGLLEWAGLAESSLKKSRALASSTKLGESLALRTNVSAESTSTTASGATLITSPATAAPRESVSVTVGVDTLWTRSEILDASDSQDKLAAGSRTSEVEQLVWSALLEEPLDEVGVEGLQALRRQLVTALP